MAKQEIREPKQKRSIEKKQSIIMASYKLFCDKGYYKTNTAEIAQEAGVSTGIVYNYFQDKKDILLEVIKFYISILSEQFQPLLSAPITKSNLPTRIEQFIDISIASHTMHVEAHNEFLALSLLEEDILILFNDFENTVLMIFYELLLTAGFSRRNLLEKIRISYGLVEQVCHYYIQRKLSQEELNTSKLLAIHTIVTLLEK
ncbi:AcrR family transcriptional regulator [Anaerocolumna cellulosilytica]|uniref:AcrR family transcriptional regulator n=1 Tax=Anaerocolumna cellulosilytica TaxID=433286 RepID=A0A6S6QTT8_9FIRM|nr:TetR/AcrR family transcriptional regulator [Anaerocolumna cellulosilytica]MBB5197237.1 AcrR family transcriptional regulator [Anaerocolumna cellulosilytica]BCJ94044.1 AcrR family transcriptional regulator [Anaerocolumna cellulosilytica]